MSEIKRLSVFCEYADGTVREYRTQKNPAGMTWKFDADGEIRASSRPDNPVSVTVQEWPARPPGGGAFCACCLDNDCECEGEKLC
jgi:hypothetical protein